MVEVVYEGEVCPTCALWIANRDVSHLDTEQEVEWWDGVIEQNLGGMGDVVVGGLQDGYAPLALCDYCGARYEGERYDVAVLD